MLINAADFEAIVAGRVYTAFRRWVRPTVKAGGTLTTSAGVLAVDAVDAVALNAVSEADLKRAGFADRAALDAMIGKREGTLHRIRLRYVGDDPRAALREASAISSADAAELTQTIERMDGATPWARVTLELIKQKPGALAQELAEALGREKIKFKSNVRRLKSLGLTESLAVSYRLSPRGGGLAEPAYCQRLKVLRCVSSLIAVWVSFSTLSVTGTISTFLVCGSGASSVANWLSSRLVGMYSCWRLAVRAPMTSRLPSR